jgi:hypothetical protein
VQPTPTESSRGVAFSQAPGKWDDSLSREPTRSPKRNAELKSSEIAQMLEATNHYRRLRGAPEQTLDDVLDAHMAQPLP